MTLLSNTLLFFCVFFLYALLLDAVTVVQATPTQHVEEPTEILPCAGNGTCAAPTVININPLILSHAWNGELHKIQVLVKELQQQPNAEIFWNGSGDDDHNNAIHLAAFRGHYDVAKYLLYMGMEIDSVNKNGDTPLLLATNREFEELIDYFICHGADVNHQNNDGDTPIIRAAYQGNLPIVKFLVQSGADYRHENKYGGTALTEAEKEKYPNVVEYLRSLLDKM